MAEREQFPIVGIGASAGGLEAIEAFLRPMPPDSGMAFVILTHLGPGQKSSLGEILKRFTAMQVIVAEDGQELMRNHVYVLPSEAILTVEKRRLRLGDPSAEQRERHPIDIFFTSLAKDCGEDAIGIILSGSGTDGTVGVKAIKEAGGLSLAQAADHTAPAHASMPASAIATGLVDLALPVQDMAAKLVDYVRSFEQLGPLTEVGTPEFEKAEGGSGREAICQLLRTQTGHDFSGYKEKTFMRRVQRRMQVLHLGALERYIERLRAEPGEADLLFRDLLISVTSFFRDKEAFAALEATVVPSLLQRSGSEGTVRVWVPGCASGEEAYSLAILLCEQMRQVESGLPTVQVFATDIDESALSLARAGRYPSGHLQGVSAARRDRFFKAEGDFYIVTKEVRDLCTFSMHSVIRDPPFSRIDLVSCRNLLIYMDTALQRQTLPVFHYALRPGGYLFLGTSENVNQHSDLFNPVDKKQRIYQRRDHVAAPVHLAMLQTHTGTPITAAGEREVRPTKPARELRELVDTRVLEHFAPAHVVVNREGDVVYYSPRTGKYLEAAAGTPSRQLVALTRRELRLELRTCLREVTETRAPVISQVPVSLTVGERVQMVSLRLEPLSERNGDPLYLVVFNDVGPSLSAEEMADRQRGNDDRTLQRLEHELMETRERLQSTIEEYETAVEELKSGNEELVSVNEELQSANEELESSREELTSVNEELNTVNTDLGEKIARLDEANADLQNLFNSTEIPTIFLDRHAVIRSFTPAVTSVFNLIPADRGRPLTDIVARLEAFDLGADVRSVLETNEPLQRPLRHHDGVTHYLMRILPYRVSEDELDGAIVTFVDVTPMIRAEEQRQTVEQQRLLVAELNHRVRNMLQVVTSVASQTLKWATSPEALSETLMSRLHALGQAYDLLSRHSWADTPMQDLVQQQLKPYAGNGRVIGVDGPRVLLKPKATLALGMILHELATNAAKHGGLSVAEGQLDVSWGLTQADGDARKLVLHWRELGGPLVQAPTRRGFGSELIQRQIRYEFGGEAALEFAETGLVVTLDLPLGPDIAVAPEPRRPKRGDGQEDA